MAWNFRWCNPAWQTLEKRASRQQLIAVANAYFEAVQKNDGKGYYPFTDDCDRLENGSHTTNTPSPNPTTPGGFNYMGLNCKKQLESGYQFVLGTRAEREVALVSNPKLCARYMKV